MRLGNPSSILVTKIEPPRLTGGLLERPRLLALLPLVCERQLTLIKAPAGFGKTSVGAAWAQRLRENAAGLVAWLDLDPDDDVPSRFLYYVAHAMRRASAAVGSSAIDMISEISLLPIETAIATLINELAELDDDVFLFLDDYQNVSEPAIHDGIAFLLRHASSNLHLVLIGRTDPPLPLARLRAQSQLLELDASSLRFDLTETRRFLEQENIRRLDADEVAILHSMTDGWPAALRLIASVQRADRIEPYVRSMLGGARPIEAYMEDMLSALPPELVQFMLRTSILERFNAPLCDAVTRATSSRQSLDSIAKRQLLMTPLGVDEHWYRYHPLLAEFLRQRLAAQLGSELPQLHRDAAQWYASKELWTDAVGHALAAGEKAEALGWIENCAMAMVKRGELLTLLAWQRQFPDHVMRGQLRVRLAIAWGMALAMRFQESLALLSEIERDIAATPMPLHDKLVSECQTIRAVDVALQDDSRTALHLAEPCLRASGGDAWNVNVASNVVRFGLWKAGDLEAFYAVPWVPYADEDDHRNVLSHVYRLCLQGLAEVQQLRFDIAERHFVEALRRGERQVGSQSTCAALPAALLARIQYEQGRLDEAEAMIGDRLSLINATAMLECVLQAYVVLSRIAVSRSNVERAYALLEQAANLGHTRHWGRLIAAVQVERVRLYIGEGRLTEASGSLIQLDALAAEYRAPVRCAWSEIEDYLQLARAHMALAKRDPAGAVTILNVLREKTAIDQRRFFGMRLDTLLAIALLDAGQPVEAMEVFRALVTVGAPAGIYRTILDAGPEIGLLISQLCELLAGKRERPPILSHVDRLLDGWKTLYGPTRRRDGGAAECLSPREHGILELIANGQSNREVAKSLGIAPETVKSHVKNIFTKLGVERRAQAVARAQSIGLLRTAAR